MFTQKKISLMNNMELRRGIEELFKLKIEENEKLKNDLNEIKRKNHKLMKSFEDEIFLNKNLKNENEILKKEYHQIFKIIIEI